MRLILVLFFPVALLSQDFSPTYAQILKAEALSREPAPVKKLPLTPPAFEKKSVSAAFFYSLLLPGMGEAYVGKTDYTTAFLTVEAAGWALYLSNILNVDGRDRQYKNYAVQHAGIDRSGKDKQYWIDIGKFSTIYEHNEERRRQRNIEGLYDENRSNFWQWDDDQNRLHYDWMRIRAREIERKEIFYIGGIVLNHLVSAINALRLARAYNREQEQLSWNWNLHFRPEQGELSFSLSKHF